MKREYTLSLSNSTLEEPNKELAVFTRLLSHKSGREILERFTGQKLDATVQVVHNTGIDDPPDLEAFGLGFEVTDFPPDQVPKDKVGQKFRGIRNDPPLHKTGGEFSEIQKQSAPNPTNGGFYDPNAEVSRLKAYVIEKLIEKDVTTNQVILLNQYSVVWTEIPDKALAAAISETALKNVRLIVVVRQSETVQFFPARGSSKDSNAFWEFFSPRP